MYLLNQNGVITYPYSVSQFRLDHPQVSLPQSPTTEQLTEVGLFLVTPSAKPVVDYRFVVTEVTPVQVDGEWTQTWEVSDATPEQQAAALEVLKKGIVDATQRRLDAFAQTRGYDGILSACTYAGSAVQRLASEGAYCVTQRDATWETLYAILAEVTAGTRPVPGGFADVEGELPTLQWPV